MHGFVATFEEPDLPVDDGAGYLEERLVAVLEILQEPLGVLQVFLQVLVGGARIATTDHPGVAAVDTQPGCRIPVQFHAPATVSLGDEYIWLDVFDAAAADAAARTGIEGTYQRHDLDEFAFGEPHLAGEADEVSVGEQREVISDEIDGLGSTWSVRGKLV